MHAWFIAGTGQTDAVYLLTQPSAFPRDAENPAVKNTKATVTKIGNVWTNDSMWWGTANDEWPAQAVPNALAGLDLLRRLARVDLAVHYPELGVTDTCA